MSQALTTIDTSGEINLLDYCRQISRHRAGRHALHIKLSKLSKSNAGSYANRNTATFLHPMIKAEKGRLFKLSSGDAVFVGSTAPESDILAAGRKIMSFFEKDTGLDGDPEGLIDHFDLEAGYEALLARCEDMLEAAKAPPVEEPAAEEKPEADQPSAQPDSPFVKQAPADNEFLGSIAEKQKARPPRRLFFEEEEIKPISPADLDRLESNFRILDPTNLLIDMPVAAVIPGMAPQVIFSEKSIDYDSLQAAVLPSRDMRGDHSLFERLCRVVEQQLIKKMQFDTRTTSLANSLPSNVQTVLSGAFLQFDLKHRRGTNLPLIIDIRLQDALGNMSLFLKARERVRDRGYRVCLSGMTTYAFAAMDHSHRLADFIKVEAPDALNELDELWLSHFKDSAKKAGQNRMIMCGCDAEDDINAGRALGFSLFQGKYVNTLLLGNTVERKTERKRAAAS